MERRGDVFMAEIIQLHDIDAPELAVFARLTEAQLRNRLEPEKGIFIAESPKVIKTALDAGLEPLSILCQRRHIGGKARELIERCGDIPVYTGEHELLERLTGYALTRGVLCAMRRPPEKTPEQVCAGARRAAVLEGVVDATNIGAIFRSAAALGVDAVLLTPACCDVLNRRAVRVSMGAVFQIPWAYVDRVSRLKELGFVTVALALDENALDIDDERLMAPERLALVFGAEGDGLARSTVAECDYTARIPMSRQVDSLNVAAASAVAFWQLRRR